MRYIAFIYKDDNSYSAIVPDLNGCVSYGDTFLEACDNIQEAGELWLENANFPKPNEFEYFTDKKLKELDIPKNAHTYIINVTQDKTVRVNFTMSKALLEKVDSYAKEAHINRSKLIAEALEARVAI